LPEPPTILSINCGISGVNRPDSNPPTAIISRFLEVLSEAMAWVKAFTSIPAAWPSFNTMAAVIVVARNTGPVHK
jgi:hypothetical protein